MSNFTKKTVSVFLTASTAVWLSGAAMLVPTVTYAATVEELQAQIADLLKQIEQLQSQLAAVQGTAAPAHTFATDLYMGMQNDDVKALQEILIAEGVWDRPDIGATGYFGPITKAAVIKYQEKYADEILAPLGLTAGTGYVGPSTRAHLNARGAVAAAPAEEEEEAAPAEEEEEGAPAVGANELLVEAADQPAASLAPESASRLPFTKIKLTAGSSDVVVNSITVERTGLASDSCFDGVVLLDEDGTQIGIAKTFNSVHQAKVGTAFTIKAGETKTLTIAGNMASNNDSRAGQVAYLSVVGVNTDATVTGTLPITGAGHTINATLSIGSVSVARGPLDPGSSVTEEIGTTDYTFSSIKVTAGSDEKVWLHSIRWYQSGSASADDLDNVKVYVDGTAYDTVVSSDGKYYTATFNNGEGILIDKGFSKEISIKGDIIGGSGRTIDFDIYKRTDLYLKGETYGYGITPPNGTDTSGTDDGAFHQDTQPWYDAYEVTVSAGTLNVTKASSVEAQNIAINLADQVLGGFEVEAKGESVSVAQMYFYFLIGNDTAAADVEDITNISLYDEDGNVVAGPVDGVNSGDDASGYAKFTDTVTFPVGKHTYILKGKLGTDFTNNQTITASTTPSTDWTSVTGLTTGDTITPSPTSAVTGNQMTVKSAAVTLSVSAEPVAQTVVAGISGFTFAKYIFDATASGEDVKFTSVPLAYDVVSGSATDLTNCQLWDGSTALNTGSNVVNPSAESSSTTFTFDSPGLVIPKGTTKIISLKCDIAGNAASGSAYRWGYDSAQTLNATGMTSGQDITEGENDSVGQLMTVGAGALTVELDSSSPSYQVASAGTTGVTLGVLKFHAANEAIKLERVAFQLSNTASNSPLDLVDGKIYLYDGDTLVGEAVFTSASDYATSTLSGDFIVPKDGDKRMTIKGDLAAIGTGQPGTQGHLLTVDWDADDSTGTRGVGQSGGTTRDHSSTSDTSVDGVRIFKSVPTLARITSGLSSTLITGNMKLYRFSVTADPSGDVSVYKFTFRIATSATPTGSASTTVTNLKLFAYTDSDFSQAVSGFPSGQLNTTISGLPGDGTTDINVLCNHSQGPTDDKLVIPAGQTYYFQLTADVALTGSITSGSITTTLQGDAAYPSLSGFMAQAADIDDDTNDDFIWSPNATTTSLTTHADWTNGYYVPGLSSDNMDAYTITK